MNQNLKLNKVLVIGSGPIVIGQAAEFDYAGTQCCSVLKKEGINVLLVNSNPATIMTDKAFADEIYLEPLTPDTVKRIIKKEKPDAVIASMGGQVGLTIASKLEKDGFFEENGVKLLGTSAKSIDKAEDRELFKEVMESINQPVIPSDIANTTAKAISVAKKIGYPVIIRPAFTLGGGGGGVAYTEDELKIKAQVGLDASPISQILVEKYIKGFKEIEFEVVRDSEKNAITICSMENFDPVGVHTGDSIVAAPALTLSDKEFQMLRSASLKIVDALDIKGGCNCQYALDPESMQYYVIEVNPRLSRSSALASKATGYPIAKVATKIALGYTLDEIKNDVTAKTCAMFEPALDYVVVKFPKWPFDKFYGSNRELGTTMKATGEVMAIGATFEEALMKAVRGAEIKQNTLDVEEFLNDTDIKSKLSICDDKRVFRIFAALKNGVKIEKIHQITGIDEWFLSRVKVLSDFENEICGKELSFFDYKRGKMLGYTDQSLREICGFDFPHHLDASFKMVDTCAGEFEAKTPYFYSSYFSSCERRSLKVDKEKKTILVLGSGPIRIGQGIEFDYSSVHCVFALKKLGYDVCILNNNPETVSTDYDTADRLYFEPLDAESVKNVLEAEKPEGVVVAFGGGTAISLVNYLSSLGVKILGTTRDGIDTAEDREKFDALLSKHGFLRPKGESVMTLDEAKRAANELSYPVLLRPSYVIGGQNMQIVNSDAETERYMEKILKGGIENPVLVDKYMPGIELEVDAICDGEDVLIPGIMQHIERAGVHSGDSIAVFPPFSLTDKQVKKVVDVTTKLAKDLKTKGLVNVQYLIFHGELYIIEVNPRASRTVPYLSKVTGVNMVEIASNVMLGKTLREMGLKTGLLGDSDSVPYFAVKAPVFSFEKLTDANSQLSPEMKSTGEALGVSKTLAEALFKALLSSGLHVDMPISKKKRALLSVDENDSDDLLSCVKKMADENIELFATSGTAKIIESLGVCVKTIPNDDCLSFVEKNELDFIVYTGALFDSTLDTFIKVHKKAVLKGISCFTSLDTLSAFLDILSIGFTLRNTELVDITKLRAKKQKIKFKKMSGTSNDYIFINNFDGSVTSPESLCLTLCDQKNGIGATGIVLIEQSDVADCKMRLFNRDGTHGMMGGNAIRCVAKFIFDEKIKESETLFIEDDTKKVHEVFVTSRGSKVLNVSVKMGKADFSPEAFGAEKNFGEVKNRELIFDNKPFCVTCLGISNPHCVVFLNEIESLDLNKLGPKFENAPYFKNRINTEFVRVVSKNHLKLRVFERSNGETLSCGTGACAAAVAAVELNISSCDTDIKVSLPGGDLIVNVSKSGEITLTGDAKLLFSGEIEV